MPRTTHDDVTIHYVDEGEGEPLLLLHGHTLDQRVWDDVAPILVAAGRRVIRPDLRGHGRSSVPPSGYHWSHHSADMAAVMNAAGIEGAVVVGFSLGGGVALEMAVTMEERVEGLVLLAPVMPDRAFEPEFMDNLREVARVVRADGVAAAMAGPWARSPLLQASVEQASVRHKLEEIVRDFPGADYLATARDRVDRDWLMPDRLAEIGAPALVVVGAREMPGFRAFAEEAAAGIGGAELEVIDGCGHLLPLEAAQRVAELIVGPRP